MPNRPRPTAPQTFDVFKPGKGRPSPTSRPVITGHQPHVQDHTVVEKKGAPVPNAHPGIVSTSPKPVLKSLAPHGGTVAPAAPAPEPTHQTPAAPALARPPRAVAPSAHALHAPLNTHHMVTHTGHAPEPAAPAAALPEKKVSRTGSTIAPPSVSAGHKLKPISINVTEHKEVKPAEPPKPEEPHLAALPITPVEAPSGLTSQKTEGKAELLAAMPIEIRRSIASADGMSASDWEMPSADESPAAPAAATPAPAAAAPAAAAADPAAEAAPAPAAPAPVEQAAPAAAAAPAPAPAAPALDAIPEAPVKMKGKLKKPLSFEAFIFIVMFVLFVGLGALIILLFMSGSVKI